MHWLCKDTAVLESNFKCSEGGLFTLVYHWLTCTVLFENRPLIMFWLDVCSLKATTASAPASPVLVNKPRPLSMALPSSNSPLLSPPTTPTDGPKKRRAPQPPVLVSQSFPSDLSTRERLNSEPNAQLDSDQVSQHSSEHLATMVEWQGMISVFRCVVYCM